jgi:hypothetical protein
VRILDIKHDLLSQFLYNMIIKKLKIDLPEYQFIVFFEFCLLHSHKVPFLVIPASFALIFHYD